jgi:hypothetical protein
MNTVQSWFSDNLRFCDCFAKEHIFNLLHKIITLCDLVTDFLETKCVTKSRVHCTSSIVKYRQFFRRHTYYRLTLTFKEQLSFWPKKNNMNGNVHQWPSQQSLSNLSTTWQLFRFKTSKFKNKNLWLALHSLGS